MCVYICIVYMCVKNTHICIKYSLKKFEPSKKLILVLIKVE